MMVQRWRGWWSCLLLCDEVLHHHVGQVLAEGVTVLVTGTHALAPPDNHKQGQPASQPIIHRQTDQRLAGRRKSPWVVCRWMVVPYVSGDGVCGDGAGVRAHGHPGQAVAQTRHRPHPVLLLACRHPPTHQHQDEEEVALPQPACLQ